jgi:hypothetical protein
MSVEMLDDTAADEVAGNTEDELTEQHTEGWDLINDTTSMGPFIRSAHSESSITLADDFISAPYARLSSPSQVLSWTPFTPCKMPSDVSYLLLGCRLPTQLINTAYITLLCSIINSARASTFLSRGSFNIIALTDSLNLSNKPFKLCRINKLY